VIWKILHDKISFQIDTYTSQQESAFSIILLDCFATDHSFSMSYNDVGPATHRLTLRYRQAIRMGANGDLSFGQDDRVSDSDFMMAKIIAISP